MCLKRTFLNSLPHLLTLIEGTILKSDEQMQSSCTFHVPQLKFAKELEIRNYEHLKNAYSKKWKIWAGSNKKNLFLQRFLESWKLKNSIKIIDYEKMKEFNTNYQLILKN